VKSLRAYLEVSPLRPRVYPFVAFLVLTSCQGLFGGAAQYWLYLAKTVLGFWMLLLIAPLVLEMKWKFSWESIAAGVLVFGLWIGLDPFYPKMGGSGPAWNPYVEFGDAGGLGLFFVVVRIIGSTLVVPPLEEVFYRSFLYRYVERVDFLSIPLGRLIVRSFLITCVVFGVAHPAQWLAALLCAAIYQGLVSWKKRLGDAITAHAVTNLLLGIWVAWKGAWEFW
jgi:CAAX prenyl protease-like protein